MRLAATNENQHVLPDEKRWDVIILRNGKLTHHYYTDGFDDIKDEHKPACLLLMAACIHTLNGFEEEDVCIPGIGQAVFFAHMGPVFELQDD